MKDNWSDMISQQVAANGAARITAEAIREQVVATQQVAQATHHVAQETAFNAKYRKLCPQCGQDNWEVVCLNEVK